MGFELSDFGGQFITTKPLFEAGRTLSGVSAYLQWFKPVISRKVSVTFVHGGGGQGSEFLRTPDGRPGWAHAFLKAGFIVNILDRPGHGRNYWNAVALGESTPPPSYETIMPRFVDVAVSGLWPAAKLHHMWPDEEEARHRFMASQGPMPISLSAAQRHIEAIAPALFDVVGDTVLVTHSAGGPCGWALSACGGNLVKAIVAVEPLGAPGMSHALGSFDNGLCAESFIGSHDAYAPPIAVVTADATWMRESNLEVVNFLHSRGADVTHLDLPKSGIYGNGHMMMSEKNSDQIADVILNWIEEAGVA